MRTLNWYLDEAKKRNEIKSDRQLGVALGKQPGLVVSYRKFRAAPTPETMIKLAQMAGVPEEVALADLGYWTNFDTEAAPIYEEMASIVAKAKNYASASLIGAGLLTGAFTGNFSTSVEASDGTNPRHSNSHTLYIMGNY